MKKKARYIGMIVTFDYSGKRLTGAVVSERPTIAEPGHIPDHILSVKGASGKILEVSVVENYIKIKD